MTDDEFYREAFLSVENLTRALLAQLSESDVLGELNDGRKFVSTKTLTFAGMRVFSSNEFQITLMANYVRGDSFDDCVSPMIQIWPAALINFESRAIMAMGIGSRLLDPDILKVMGYDYISNAAFEACMLDDRSVGRLYANSDKKIRFEAILNELYRFAFMLDTCFSGMGFKPLKI